MRLLKFRQKVGDSWHYWGFLSEGTFIGPAYPHVRSYQYTDRTCEGQEIYEGDIVKVSQDNEEYTMPVEWEDNKDFIGWSFAGVEVLEIVGNTEGIR